MASAHAGRGGGGSLGRSDFDRRDLGLKGPAARPELGGADPRLAFTGMRLEGWASSACRTRFPDACVTEAW